MASLTDLANAQNPGMFWFLITVATIAACVMLWMSVRLFHRLRVIEDTPTSRLRSAAQGYVELEGHADWLDGGKIHAPLSGRPAVWYSFRVECRSGNDYNRRSRSWRVVERETSNEFFVLDDDTGYCIVDPEGASVVAAERFVWYGDTPRPQVGPRTRNWGIGRRYRYIEEVLPHGCQLYALGQYTTAGGAGSALPSSQELADVLREWKRDYPALLQRFDADKNGTIDPGEWRQAREAAWQEILQRRSDVGPPPAVDLMTRTDDARRPFLLSAMSQTRMTRRLRWQAFALVSVGLVLAALVIQGLLTQL
ncbi:MAG: hypothetical protein H6978_09810 [Gammaproteobacteria bacterium]|nr:hypothetical protein [Gammaproteobacteria bacterium]